MLHTICLSDQPAQLLLVLGCHLRLDGSGLCDGIPITPGQRFLQVREQRGDGFTSDGLLPRLGRYVGPGFAQVGEALGDKGQRRGILVDIRLC